MELNLLQGNNLELLKTLPSNSVDSVVTDPPYGLSFMGKKWDYDVPSVDTWKEVLRVLKPGGHVLSFGGTRTYHRMVVNIEDAGFEIRDQIMWIYGSGFPKSHNIGKAIDKIEGNDRVEWLDEKKTQPNIKGGGNQLMISSSGEKAVDREPIKYSKGQSQYEGWGTAMKPANEPICVARKPLSEKSVGLNVLEWGTGGINIDGCRIGTEDSITRTNVNGFKKESIYSNNQINGGDKNGVINDYGSTNGRWPANIILDETAGELLDKQSGITKSGKNAIRTSNGLSNEISGMKGIGVKEGDNNGEYGDKGGASRFFYVAKTSKSERNMGLDGFEDKETNSIGSTYAGNQDTSKIGGNPDKPTLPSKNNHPTIKPVNLMSYLVKLVTPVGGVVLDPYMGSGGTGIAAQLNGFSFVGMEMDEDYFKIASARITEFEQYRKFIKK